MRTFLTALANRRRPVLRWEGVDGASLELSGPVLANWVHKAHGLLADSDVGPDLDLGVVDARGLHWRALSGALAAWSLGACVRMIDDEEPETAWAAIVSEDHAEDAVTHSADEVFIFPVAPLSLGVDVPPDTIDFATALRAYPDDSPVGTTTQVSFGDATNTTTVDLRTLTDQPSSPGDQSAHQATTSTAAEVVVTSAPRTATEWGAILHGLLNGVVIFRHVDV